MAVNFGIIKLSIYLSMYIYTYTYDAHTDPIFKELKILKFVQIHFLQLGLFMFSYN